MSNVINFPTPESANASQRMTGREAIQIAQDFGNNQIDIIDPNKFLDHTGIKATYGVTARQMQLGNLVLLPTRYTVKQVHDSIPLGEAKQKADALKPDQTKIQSALLRGAGFVLDRYEDYAKKNRLNDQTKTIAQKPPLHSV